MFKDRFRKVIKANTRINDVLMTIKMNILGGTSLLPHRASAKKKEETS